MQLKNKAQREQFLDNYKKWEVMAEISELELKFYKHTLPNGTVIIATEHTRLRFSGKSASGNVKDRDVKYHLILDESDTYKAKYSFFEHKVYNPSGDSKTSIIEYLTRIKPEINFGGEANV